MNVIFLGSFSAVGIVLGLLARLLTAHITAHVLFNLGLLIVLLLLNIGNLRG